MTYGPPTAYGPASGYGRGSGYGRRFAGPSGPLSREATAAQLEAHLAALRDEVRALEADLAELTRGASATSEAPEL